MKKKKALKGFTLLELIIVMALFSLIMYSVVSLLDPVSKFFVRSSNFESATACVDNMKRAIEGNLKYVDRVRVYSDFVPYDAAYTPSVDMQAHVEQFWEDFFEDRQFLDCEGTIRVMVFDNSVDSTVLSLTRLSDFTDGQRNSGKITMYEFPFDNTSVNFAARTCTPWYVNQKMYGNYDYQFHLGSFEPATPSPSPAFDPADCTVTISAYEISRNGQGTGLSFNPAPQNNTASFSMKNVLDGTRNYTTPLDDFKLLLVPGASGYSIDGAKKYEQDTTPIPRYAPLVQNSANAFGANIVNAFGAGAGEYSPGFYFIFTLSEEVNDVPDVAYMNDVNGVFGTP